VLNKNSENTGIISNEESSLGLSADVTDYRALCYDDDSDGSKLDSTLVERGLGIGRVVVEELIIPTE